jgi:hypothetical protein
MAGIRGSESDPETIWSLNSYPRKIHLLFKRFFLENIGSTKAGLPVGVPFEWGLSVGTFGLYVDQLNFVRWVRFSTNTGSSCLFRPFQLPFSRITIVERGVAGGKSLNWPPPELRTPRA